MKLAWSTLRPFDGLLFASYIGGSTYISCILLIGSANSSKLRLLLPTYLLVYSTTFIPMYIYLHYIMVYTAITSRQSRKDSIPGTRLLTTGGVRHAIMLGVCVKLY